MPAANARVTLSVSVFITDGQNNGKLLFILLTFLSAAREKLQKSAAKDRTYGSSLDSNSLVTLAVPR